MEYARQRSSYGMQDKGPHTKLPEASPAQWLVSIKVSIMKVPKPLPLPKRSALLLNLPKGELSGVCKKKVLILYARQKSSYEGARSVSSTMPGVRTDIRSVHEDRQRRVRLEYARQRSSYCMQDKGAHTKILWCRTCSACVPKGISLEVR